MKWIYQNKLFVAFFAVSLCFGDNIATNFNSQTQLDVRQQEIRPPFRLSNPSPQAQYYTNEGFRAASFGSMKIARDLFYKACVMGDDMGCLALNEARATHSVNKLLVSKQECDYGVAEACFGLYTHYSSESMLDSFRATWYLSKACRLGHKRACEIEVNHNDSVVKNELGNLKNACFHKHAQSCHRLGTMYLFGQSVRKNPNLSAEYFKKSCDFGLREGCLEYLKILSSY